MTSEETPEELVANEFAYRLTQYSDISDHLQFMHDTVLGYPKPVVIEMGVRTGNSTSALLSAVLAKGGALWSADINRPQVQDFWHEIPSWHFRQGDSVSAEVLKWMPKRADVVFMDTSHTFEQQLAELREYVPRVKPGGTVLIHDTQCVPLDNFESDSFISKPEVEGPVADALDAFCKESGLAWVNRHSDPPYYGMGVIEIPPAAAVSDLCRACASEVEEVLDLGLHYLADFLEPGEPRGREYPLRLALCRNCTLLQLLDVVPSEAVLHDRYAFRSGINESIRADLKGIAEYADKHSWNSQRIRIWLDTGSNDGTLLSNVDPKHYLRVGVDPLRHLAADCKKHAEEVIVGYFDPAEFEEIDVITSSAMFYNLDDPRSFTQGIKNILDKDGVWVIQQNYTLDMLRNNVIDNVVHEHVTYFSVASLKRLVESFGLQVTDVSYSDAKGGCIRTAIHHKGARPVKPSVQSALNRELGYRLGDPQTWRRWGQRAQLMLAETRAELEAARDRGWRTYLYGASIRGSTFLRLIDAGPDLLPFCADRDEAKIGKIMATTGIPVISEQKMRADPPEYLLIGPWFFRDLFVAREAEYLRGGGQLIFPLPKFEVVSA